MAKSRRSRYRGSKTKKKVKSVRTSRKRSRRYRGAASLERRRPARESLFRSATRQQRENIFAELSRITPEGLTLARVEKGTMVSGYGGGWEYDVVFVYNDTELSIGVYLEGFDWINDPSLLRDCFKAYMYDTEASWVPWIVSNFATELSADLQSDDIRAQLAREWVVTHSQVIRGIDLPQRLAHILFQPGGALENT